MRCIIRKPLLTAVIVAACVAASAAAGAARAQTPAAPGDTIHADTSSRPTGTLRSGDLLKIRVYRDSELSGQYLIDAQGNVQMPGVGVIKAAGLDPTQITERMIEAFRARGFRTPEIAIQPLIRVSVLGEVRAPSLYPVEPGVSLIQLLTLAGGPTDRANLRKAQVIRENHVFTVDLESALAGKRLPGESRCTRTTSSIFRRSTTCSHETTLRWPPPWRLSHCRWSR